MSPPAGTGASLDNSVAPKSSWSSLGTTTSTVDCPAPPPTGSSVIGLVAVVPITLRIPPSRVMPSEDTATRPSETSTSAPTAASPSANALSRNATLLPGRSTWSVRAEFLIGARFGVYKTTSNTASTANGFITTR